MAGYMAGYMAGNPLFFHSGFFIIFFHSFFSGSIISMQRCFSIDIVYIAPPLFPAMGNDAVMLTLVALK
jgi:hypothetical protein